MLAGEQGEAVRDAIAYQIEVGRFFGADRFVAITNAHMMGDIEVLGDAGLALLREAQALGRHVGDVRMRQGLLELRLRLAEERRVPLERGALELRVLDSGHARSLVPPRSGAVPSAARRAR